MKKILVTGGFGFIGSHLLPELYKSKNDIFTLSRTKKTSPTHFSCNFFDNEIRENILRKVKPDIIIHLAWETTPQKFYESKQNIKWCEATIDFIEKFYKLNGKKFIFSSTCDEYGFSNIKEKILESKPCKPITLYGKSKNMVSNFLFNNYREKSIILRNFFVCGPGENKEKLLSSLIDKVIKKKPIFLKRPFDQVDFIDVRDVANIISQFAQKNNNGIFNVGTSSNNTPLSLAEKIVELKGNNQIKFEKNKFEEKDLRSIVANNNKLTNILKYKMQFDMDKTLKDLIKVHDI